jgi:hypothetical protein
MRYLIGYHSKKEEEVDNNNESGPQQYFTYIVPYNNYIFCFDNTGFLHIMEKERLKFIKVRENKTTRIEFKIKTRIEFKIRNEGQYINFTRKEN